MKPILSIVLCAALLSGAALAAETRRLPAGSVAPLPDEPRWIYISNCCPPPIQPGAAVPRGWSCRHCAPLSEEYRQALRALAYDGFNECFRAIVLKLQVPWGADDVRQGCLRAHDVAR